MQIPDGGFVVSCAAISARLAALIDVLDNAAFLIATFTGGLMLVQGIGQLLARPLSTKRLPAAALY